MCFCDLVLVFHQLIFPSVLLTFYDGEKETLLIH